MEKQSYLTSTDFARAIGVSVPTLVRWEEKGLVKPYMVTPTGYRKYTWEQVEEYFESCRQRSNVKEE